VSQVGVEDNFFELGGQSLKAIQLLARLREHLHREIPLGTFLQAQTVADLARFLQDHVLPEMLLPIRRAGPADLPLFLFHPAGGELLMYQTLIAALQPGIAVYGLQSQALLGPNPEAASLELMASAYAAAISQQQGEGPYAFFGWSLGGVLAIAVASILERRGQRVKFVGLLDSYLSDEQTDPLADLGLAFGGSLLQAFATLRSEEQDALRTRLLALSEHGRLEQVLSWGKERGLLPAMLPVEAFSKQAALVRTHRALLNAYQAPLIEAPLAVWWARESPQVRTDWSRYTTGGVQEKTVAGNHFTVIQSPTIETIAQELNTILPLS
jgi:thioesterase domain-containing protein/acyl carrier protein